MPNLVPPVTSVEAARDYRKRILEATAPGFTPLMTCYLTDQTGPDEIQRGFDEGVWVAAKLYPAGATTNSASGVTDIRNIYPALTRMEKIGMVLCVHGEVTDPDVDVFDREAVFIDRILSELVRDFPGLKIVFEHITTAEAAQFVDSSAPTIGATITPQHLIINRNAIFAGGLRPHAYCLPVAKRERHRLADVRLAQILSRHRQRPAFAGGEGKRLRLRGHLQRAVRARKLCDCVRGGGGCARPLRGIRLHQRREFLRPAGQRRDGDARALLPRRPAGD
jgi:dihydroorotase